MSKLVLSLPSRRRRLDSISYFRQLASLHDALREVAGVLAKDPKARPTAATLLGAPWFQSARPPESPAAGHGDLIRPALVCLCEFVSR